MSNPVEIPAWLLTWARLPGSTAVLRTVRAKVENGTHGDRVRVGANLTEAERRDAGRLLGSQWERSGKPTTVGAVRKAVGAACEADAGAALAALLIAHSGPLRDLPAERAVAAHEHTSRRERAIAALTEAGVDAAVAELAVRRRWLGGTENTEGIAAHLASLLRHLPADPPRLLPELAAALFDDPHALDRQQALGRAAVRVLAATQDLDNFADTETLAATADGSLIAARWRGTWQRAGVLCDRVSSTVLVLNLPLDGSNPAAALTSSAPGEPVWLTARSLNGEWRPTERVRVVRVCENPSVVEAAADSLGDGCPPLVCTYGRPSTAAHTLLHGLHSSGVRLLISADRDTAGTQISDNLLTTYPGAELWESELSGRYEEDRLDGLLADLALACAN